MRLSGLTLDTSHFDEYLSFLTEVLELDLHELTDDSMKLDLQGTWLEIKKVESAPHQAPSQVEFSLYEDEFIALVHKVSFFYYRKGPTRFTFLGVENGQCGLIDPDGRHWRFASPQLNSFSSPRENIL